MFEPIGFLTSRTGIAVIGALAVSVALVWGYQNKAAYLNEKNSHLQDQRDYQARIAEALEKQRKALDAAIMDERRRRIDLENKWKNIDQANKETADYEKTAPASIINTLNGLSERSASR